MVNFSIVIIMQDDYTIVIAHEATSAQVDETSFNNNIVLVRTSLTIMMQFCFHFVVAAL